jgi:hypothetical protein
MVDLSDELGFLLYDIEISYTIYFTSVPTRSHKCAIWLVNYYSLLQKG